MHLLEPGRNIAPLIIECSPDLTIIRPLSLHSFHRRHL